MAFFKVLRFFRLLKKQTINKVQSKESSNIKRFRKKPWYPLKSRLGGPRAGPNVVMKTEISGHTGTRAPVVQFIAARYTDDFEQ
jgi:hypothetical protein